MQIERALQFRIEREGFFCIDSKMNFVSGAFLIRIRQQKISVGASRIALKIANVLTKLPDCLIVLVELEVGFSLNVADFLVFGR